MAKLCYAICPERAPQARGWFSSCARYTIEHASLASFKFEHTMAPTGWSTTAETTHIALSASYVCECCYIRLASQRNGPRVYGVGPLIAIPRLGSRLAEVLLRAETSTGRIGR